MFRDNGKNWAVHRKGSHTTGIYTILLYCTIGHLFRYKYRWIVFLGTLYLLLVSRIDVFERDIYLLRRKDILIIVIIIKKRRKPKKSIKFVTMIKMMIRCSIKSQEVTNLSRTKIRIRRAQLTISFYWTAIDHNRLKNIYLYHILKLSDVDVCPQSNNVLMSICATFYFLLQFF